MIGYKIKFTDEDKDWPYMAVEGLADIGCQNLSLIDSLLGWRLKSTIKVLPLILPLQPLSNAA